MSNVTRLVWPVRVLLCVVGVLLAAVIVAPIALSSQDIIGWAASPDGLGLAGPWPVVTFAALDAAAAVCVGVVVYCAWRGEPGGVFGPLVWVFAATSAYSNYRHGTRAGAPGDAVWFFPVMSLAGPFLLEVTVRRARKWVQEGDGRRARHGVSFGVARWIPGVGALRETYGAWRLARLAGIDDADHAVSAYRALCPTGSVRVLRALRTHIEPTPAADTDADTAADSRADSDPNYSQTPQRTTGAPVRRAPRRTGSGTAGRVARLRAGHPDMPASEIARRVGVTDRTVRRHLAAQDTATDSRPDTRADISADPGADIDTGREVA